MSLPRVKIDFSNGALGQVVPMDDGCIGLLALGATEVVGEGKFKLATMYLVKSLAGIEDLGVTLENNDNLYRNVKDFYSEAGNGVELFIMAFPSTATFTSILDKDNSNGAISLIKQAKGKIRTLVAIKTPEPSYTVTIMEGLDTDIATAIIKAQGLGEWATNDLKAPIFTLLEGYGFTGNSLDVVDLCTMTNGRVGVVIGDTKPDSLNACMGIVAGRLAISPVQRKISRVKDGALTPLEIYVGSELAESADVSTLHSRGYITFTTFVGKAGYFIADDNLATEVKDDYRSITNRRVGDKAYRIAYVQSLESLNDEIPIATDGTLSPAWCGAVMSDIEDAIISNMTANGNLGNDPANTGDTGVECTIDYKQKILATSKFLIKLRVKPYGYAKYIDVDLGFKTK